MFTVVSSVPLGRMSSVLCMFRRFTFTTIALTSVAMVGATALVAVGSAVSGPAQVFEVADRGAEQVQTNPPPATPTARYRVTLNANWTSSTHPGSLPPNEHFSPPVIAVHSAPGAMFTVGSLASPGIEAMAEVGSTGGLISELTGSGQVSTVDAGSRIPGPGSSAPAVSSPTFDVDVSQSGHLISVVSMLAPSPDWFVGFADRATFVDGQWIDSVTFPLGNYDSGTDSGPGFTSGNADTQPAQPISGPRDSAFIAAAAENPFATVTITKIG